MRMMAQLAAVLARIMGAKNAQDYAQAQQIVQDAYGELFGLQPELVEHADAATLALLLGEAEKIKGLAALLREEGEALLLQGKPLEGRARFEKALALYQETMRLQTKDDEECVAAIAELEARLDNLNEHSNMRTTNAGMPSTPL